MGKMMVNLFMASMVSLTGAPQPPKAPAPDTIRLYVFTAPPVPSATKAETEETDLKERVQATQDITNWLRDKKKTTISLVASKDLADVIVEVAAVQHAAGMSLTERTSGYLHGPRYDSWTVRAKVTAGVFTSELSHEGQFPSIAAEAVANDLEKWTQKNRDKLIAQRPK